MCRGRGGATSGAVTGGGGRGSPGRKRGGAKLVLVAVTGLYWDRPLPPPNLRPPQTWGRGGFGGNSHEIPEFLSGIWGRGHPECVPDSGGERGWDHPKILGSSQALALTEGFEGFSGKFGSRGDPGTSWDHFGTLWSVPNHSKSPWTPPKHPPRPPKPLQTLVLTEAFLLDWGWRTRIPGGPQNPRISAQNSRGSLEDLCPG